MATSNSTFNLDFKATVQCLRPILVKHQHEEYFDDLITKIRNLETQAFPSSGNQDTCMMGQDCSHISLGFFIKDGQNGPHEAAWLHMKDVGEEWDRPNPRRLKVKTGYSSSGTHFNVSFTIISLLY